MSKQRRRSLASLGCCLAGAASLLLMAEVVLPQQSAPATGAVNMKRQQQQRSMRETMLRTSEAEAAGEKADPRRVEAAIEQMKQDFKQIQIVRNELVRDLLASNSLNYRRISDRAAEISKRAERLKVHLLPFSHEDKEKHHNSQVEFNSDEVKDAVIRLCNLIAGFVDNPALKVPEVMNVEQSTRAGGDLLSIIALSHNIRRSAERLNKNSK